MTGPAREPLRVFYSYSHKDAKMRARLEVHLSLLRNRGLIVQWYDREIRAGDEWEREISANLEQAHIILLLISPDFLASKYCHDIEMARALERHDAGEARVVPIIIRPVLWHGEPISKLQALPTDAKPISRWKPHEEGWFDAARGIERVVNESAAKSPASDDKVPSDVDATASRPELHNPFSLAIGGANVLAEQSGDLLTDGRYEEAIEAARQALLTDPTNVAALHNMSAALDRSGKHQEAIEITNHALSLDVDNAQLWMGLGTALMNIGHVPAAAAAFRRAVESGPYFSEAWYNLAGALVDLVKIPEAIDALRQAVRIKPDFSVAWYNLGYLLHTIDQRQAAVAAFNECLRFQPDDEKTWRHLGLVQGQLGNYVAALEAISRAQSLAPDVVHSWYIRGYLEAKGEIELGSTLE